MSPEEKERPGPVGIVGLGLMGGSLARSLKAGARPPKIVASSLDDHELEDARSEGIVDRIARTTAEVVEAASLIVYATPLDVTLDLLEEHRHSWRPDTVLTDVVSLKLPVARKIREVGASGRWVGAHPMAGSEESGFSSARADLFQGARVFLVREGAGEGAVQAVSRLWEATGAHLEWIDPARHDHTMVWASHLPQLLSNALARALDRAGVEPSDLGPGGRDMTRLAGSSPELWRGLLGAAGEEEERALRRAAEELERLRDLLSRGDVDAVVDYMERTRDWRGGGSWN